jgi:pimeloyl-ACP methyl ester carboxylesterase
MLTPRSHFVRVNGIRLHVLEWGTATQRPVLLLHGGSAHARWWTFVVSALVEHHRVLALDLRGHGDSDWAEPPDYAIATHAADVVGVAAALDLTDLRVVGHSLGGLVTIASAAPLGPRLAAVVLIDTAGRIGGRSMRYLTALSHWPHPTYASQADGVRRFRLLPSANAASAAVREHVAAHALRIQPDGTWTLKFDRRALKLGDPIDLVAQLKDIDVPTLIVRGALSPHVAPTTLSELEAMLRQGATAEIANSHHHVMLDAPDDLARVLAIFLLAPGSRAAESSAG